MYVNCSHGKGIKFIREELKFFAKTHINSNGGNLICEPLETYIKGKDIIAVTKTNLGSNDLKQMYESLKKYKYHFINFNCEHFVNFATDKKLVSNQVFKWSAIIGIGILVTYLIRKNKI
jgi:hypothetical protein